MMKKIAFVLTLLSLLLLVGCKESKGIIVGPKNLNYNNETYVLSWDKVEGALKYEVVINDTDTLKTSETFISLESLEHGIYRIKVKAILKDQESLYSNSNNYFINKVKNIYMHTDKEKIYWDFVDDATYILSYKEMFNQNEVIINPKNAEFKIPEDLRDKNTVITLKTYYQDQLLVTATLELNFNTELGFLTKDFVIDINEANRVYINGVLIEEGIVIEDSKVILTKDLIGNYKGQTQVSVTGKTNISKNVYFTSELVELITSETQVYRGEDIVYEFILNGFEFSSINIVDGVFSFNGSTLTIDKEYFEAYKLSNPESTYIGMHVVFKKGSEHTKLIYLRVNL